jgi:DNA-binding transcriptional LysR family regulator
MDLDQLDAFVAVATLGGFTRASQQLHRTQPAISRRVQLLEKSLGVPLFARHGREVSLTPAGEAFLPYAEQALASVRDGVAALGDTGRGTATPLRVVLVGTLADTRLAAVLSAYRRAFPDSEVTLRTATSREVSALVQRGEADLGVRYFTDRNPQLDCVALGDETLVLVASPTSPLATGGTLTLDALVGEQWLSFPVGTDQPDSFGALLERTLLESGLADPRVTFVDSLTAQKRLVQAGYGIAFLPPSSCEDEVASGSLRKLQVPGLAPAQPIVAVRRRRGFRHPRAADLLDLLAARLHGSH